MIIILEEVTVRMAQWDIDNMANINNLAPMILRFEGGYVNNPADKGGPTNMGITLAEWKSVGFDKNGDGIIDEEDIKLLDANDFTRVLRIYWNRWHADNIQNQSIANILVDWVWGSGKWGIVIPQRVLGVSADGMVGEKTLNALNSANQEDFFNKIHEERIKFVQNIVNNHPSQRQFLKGWINRINNFKFS